MHPLGARSTSSLDARLEPSAPLCRLLGYHDLTLHKKPSFFLRDDGSKEPVTPPIPPRGPVALALLPPSLHNSQP